MSRGSRGNKIVWEVDAEMDQVLRVMQRMDQRVDKTDRKMRKLGKTTKSVGDRVSDAFGQRAMSSALSFITTLASVSTAVATIGRGYDAWIQKARIVGDESARAANEIVALAALQEGGTKAARVTQAAQLAATFGITSRGEAFNTVQALQSARGGDFGQGLTEAATVFAASRLGVDLDAAREAAVLGASQGLRPGEMNRLLFAAGQASARDPNLLATAASALKFTDDKVFGAAAAGIIAASGRAEQTETFTRRGLMALSRTGGTQEFFAARGQGDLTQLERVRELSRLGLVTPEQLQLSIEEGGVGITEIREASAVADMARQLPELERIMREINRQNQPGLFAEQIAAVEAELPTVGIERRRQTLAVMRSNMLAGLTDDQSRRELERQYQRELRGLAIESFGSSLSGMFVDDQGGASAIAGFFAEAFGAAGGTENLLKQRMAEIERRIEAGEALIFGANAINEAAQNLQNVTATTPPSTGGE